MLWVGPGVIAGLGVIAVVMLFRRRKTKDGTEEVVSGAKVDPLSEDERRRLDELLKEDH